MEATFFALRTRWSALAPRGGAYMAIARANERSAAKNRLTRAHPASRQLRAGRSPCTLPRMGARRVDRQLWVALCGEAPHVRSFFRRCAAAERGEARNVRPHSALSDYLE